MATKNKEKLVLSIFATIIATSAWTLVIAGSFVPKWARPINSTVSANSSYSLWGRQDCYDVICSTTIRRIKRVIYSSWTDENGEEQKKRETEIKFEPITKCHVANFCNTTWFNDDEMAEKFPSLLYVSRAFIIPSICTGVVTICLYVVKIVMLVLRPTWRRIHIKAAYLTFAALSGTTAAISVIIFVTMIEEDYLKLMWAPALPGVGGALFLFIAIGGYLSWRNHSTDDDFDDYDFENSDISDDRGSTNVYEFGSGGVGVPAKPAKQQQQHQQQGRPPAKTRAAPPPPAVVPKSYARSYSYPASKSEPV